MNKGTAIVGFFMSFLAGMFLMWGLDKGKGPDIQAEAGSAGSVPDQSSASVPVSAKDPQWGDPTAPVTIVTISDFQCPFCSRVEPTLKQIRDTYGPKKVRMVWKNQPLPFHSNARPAAEAAMAVFGLKGSEAFWKFHDTAFSNQQALTPENYEKWAAEAGVDKAKFKEALASKKFSAKIDEDMALSNKIGANGTPAFRINGVTVSGAQPTCTSRSPTRARPLAPTSRHPLPPSRTRRKRTRPSGRCPYSRTIQYAVRRTRWSRWSYFRTFSARSASASKTR